MEDYKQDIINTRVGCFGGSDAAMLAQIDKLGSVPQSAKKRLAVCKGLIENENITTKAMLYGDFIEQSIYEHLAAQDARYESNPCLISREYSRPNVKCIDHVDIMHKDEHKKVLTLWEVKATKYSIKETKETYKAQLYHHQMLGREYAMTLGSAWKVKVFLVHYNTEGIDLEQPFQFNENRLTIVPIRFGGAFYNMHNAMDIVSKYLEEMTEYYEGDVIPVEYLPSNVKKIFSTIAGYVREIEEKKKEVEEFKQKLFELFRSKGIKKVDVDGYMFTLVEPSTSTSFDYKSFLSDYEERYPRKYKKMRETYDKVSNKKGFIKITEKTNKQND